MQGWEAEPRFKVADRHPSAEEIKHRLCSLDWHQLAVLIEANQVLRWKYTALQAVAYLMTADREAALHMITEYDMLEALREATPGTEITHSNHEQSESASPAS